MERLTRPRPYQPRGAFDRELEAALDRLGIDPGGEFFITALGGEARTRRSDPATSRAAAESTGPLRDSQLEVLRVFETWKKPMTDEDLVRRYEQAAHSRLVTHQSPSGIRSRRNELTERGFIRDTGLTAKLASGRNGVLWGLTGAERAAQREEAVTPVQDTTKPQEAFSEALFDLPATPPTNAIGA